MFTFDVRPLDAVTARLWENDLQMTKTEFFKRGVAHDFGTSVFGLAATEMDIAEAERKAGEYDPEYNLFGSYTDMTAMYSGTIINESVRCLAAASAQWDMA